MTERQPFVAPGGTLFLLGGKDILLTTDDGGEAIVPLEDLACFLRYLDTLRPAEPSEEGPDPPAHPPGREFSRGE